ncbi:MAG: hypothetical protein ACKPJJ_10580 [Planctomycetaceae bacterium]
MTVVFPTRRSALSLSELCWSSVQSRAMSGSRPTTLFEESCVVIVQACDWVEREFWE